MFVKFRTFPLIFSTESTISFFFLNTFSGVQQFWKLNIEISKKVQNQENFWIILVHDLGRWWTEKECSIFMN